MNDVHTQHTEGERTRIEKKLNILKIGGQLADSY